MFTQEHQFDGTEWRKSNLLFGYHDIWDENLGGTATGTSWSKLSETVPEGELWVLQCVSIYNFSGNAGNTYLAVYQASGGVVKFDHVVTLDRYIPLVANGNWVLGAGAKVQVSMGGIVAGNVIVAGLIGYKMKLDM